MIPFNMSSLDKRPLGGMETAAIRLSEALEKLGHKVIFISQDNNPPLSHPLFLPMRALNNLGEIDILIAIREWKPLFLPIKAKKYMFWTGDSYNLPQSVGIGDRRIINKIDSLLCVSQWHMDALCKFSGFPKEKSYVLRNGIHKPYFTTQVNRRRKRLIYSSTPFRGLKYFLNIFPVLKERHPELELHVFSDYAVYSQSDKIDYHKTAIEELSELRKKLSIIPGIFMHGNVKQEELAKEMLKSSILAYPCDFEETSCITAMEAQAAGCAIVTSKLAALEETVDNAGLLISEKPGSDAYIHEFIAATDKLLKNDRLLAELSSNAISRAQEFDWERIAVKFSDFLGLGLYGDGQKSLPK
jgi:glycosyltransferase involved in cell wall biosynthesis